MPLTEEMLNELNKNHMGGVDNLASDTFYDVGDAWDRPTFPSKPIKVRCFSVGRLFYRLSVGRLRSLRKALLIDRLMEGGGLHLKFRRKFVKRACSRPLLVSLVVL